MSGFGSALWLSAARPLIATCVGPPAGRQAALRRRGPLLMTEVRGPLHGLRIIELAGIGPGPYAAMLLADMGAEVVRVERPGPPASGVPPQQDVLRRNRKSVVLDLRDPDGVQTLLSLIEGADVLLEGFRPGVTERLGIGPEDCWE